MAASHVSASEDIDVPSSDAPLPPPPQWYTAKRLLALFCAMQFLVYMDRGVRVSKLKARVGFLSTRTEPPSPGHRQHRRQGHPRQR